MTKNDLNNCPTDMEKEEKKFCYSFNEEIYEGEFNSSEEALKEAVKDAENREKFGDGYGEVFIAESVPKNILDYFDAEELIQLLQEKADEDVGDVAEGWFPIYPLNLEKEVLDDLNKAINDWATKHNLQPSFYGVENIQKHSITPHPL